MALGLILPADVEQEGGEAACVELWLDYCLHLHVADTHSPTSAFDDRGLG